LRFFNTNMPNKKIQKPKRIVIALSFFLLALALVGCDNEVTTASSNEQGKGTISV